MLRLLLCCWLLLALYRGGAGPAVAAGMMTGDGQSLRTAERNRPLPQRSLFSCPERAALQKTVATGGSVVQEKAELKKQETAGPTPPAFGTGYSRQGR